MQIINQASKAHIRLYQDRMRCLVHFVDEWGDFRLAELHALLQLCGLPGLTADQRRGELLLKSLMLMFMLLLCFMLCVFSLFYVIFGCRCYVDDMTTINLNLPAYIPSLPHLILPFCIAFFKNANDI